MSSLNSSLITTIKPQGTDNYTAITVILHPTKKLRYCKLRVFKEPLPDTIPCNKMSRLKKTHTGWRKNFLLPFMFYCSDWLQKDQGRALILQTDFYVHCKVLHMKHYEEPSFLFISSQYTHSTLTVNHHEYNLLVLLTQGKMDVVLTNLFSWTYYTLLMKLLLFDCQSW